MPCLTLPCLALPGLALPCLALPRLALPTGASIEPAAAARVLGNHARAGAPVVRQPCHHAVVSEDNINRAVLPYSVVLVVIASSGAKAVGNEEERE